MSDRQVHFMVEIETDGSRRQLKWAKRLTEEFTEDMMRRMGDVIENDIRWHLANTAGGAPNTSGANPDTGGGAPPPTTREEIVGPVDHTSP